MENDDEWSNPALRRKSKGGEKAVHDEMVEKHVPVGYQNCVMRFRRELSEVQTLRIRLH
jgi:hypothetical protein